MEIISKENVWNIIRKALGKVDERLIEHGERVAFIAYHMMKEDRAYADEELKIRLILCLLHDIGAYKVEEIDRMVMFETTDVMEHSIYGGLFLEELSPLGRYAHSIIYHHVEQKKLDKFTLNQEIKDIAALIHLADRADMLIQNGKEVETYFADNKENVFSGKWVACYLKASENYPLIKELRQHDFMNTLKETVCGMNFTEDEIKSYLGLIAYSIDFRSEYMVLHTITTVSLSNAMGKLAGLSEDRLTRLYYGALLHDIGKIEIPVSILEKPGKLDDSEMVIMRKHVEYTGDIIQEYIDEPIYKIAVRHHEKMNGTGYPLGLTGEQLSLEEQICAVADIMSALMRKRSYKDAYDHDKVKGILLEMMKNGELCQKVVSNVLEHFETLVEASNEYGKNMMAIYLGLHQKYTDYMDTFKSI